VNMRREHGGSPTDGTPLLGFGDRADPRSRPTASLRGVEPRSPG